MSLLVIRYCKVDLHSTRMLKQYDCSVSDCYKVSQQCFRTSSQCSFKNCECLFGVTMESPNVMTVLLPHPEKFHCSVIQLKTMPRQINSLPSSLIPVFCQCNVCQTFVFQVSPNLTTVLPQCLLMQEFVSTLSLNIQIFIHESLTFKTVAKQSSKFLTNMP